MLIVRNELREVARAAEWVADIAREEALSPRLAFRVDLCLEEALANVVAYAFPGGGSHDVVVRCETDADSVMLEVEDDGRAFDPWRSRRHAGRGAWRTPGSADEAWPSSATSPRRAVIGVKREWRGDCVVDSHPWRSSFVSRWVGSLGA
jgi:hypothetical protein